MATVYKRTNRKPIPGNATVARDRKSIPSGAGIDNQIANWIDRDGCKRTAVVRGGKIVAAFAKWRGSQGEKSAPVDHEEVALLVVDDNYTADFRIGTRRVRKSTRVADKALAQRIANQWGAGSVGSVA